MKKLLFIILTLLFTTELFSYECAINELSIFHSQGKDCVYYSDDLGYAWTNKPERWPCSIVGPKLTYIATSSESSCLSEKSKKLPIPMEESTNQLCFLDSGTGKINCTYNPDPAGGSRCADTFIKNGQFYNCDPSTNKAEFVENSEGYEEREDGIYPKCKAGYSVHNIGRLTSSGTENQFYCLKNSNDEPSKWV